MAEPASKLTERLLSITGPHAIVGTCQEAASALEECEAYAKEGWDWLGKALEALGAPTVFDIEARAAALEQAEKALRALRRLASKESFTGAIDLGVASAEVIWRELQARGKYATEALASLVGDGADEEATCEHRDTHFDRALCACGAMHDYCNDCGEALHCPLDEPTWDESQEGQEADRPEDLPVPANADKRYDELDGG